MKTPAYNSALAGLQIFRRLHSNTHSIPDYLVKPMGVDHSLERQRVPGKIRESKLSPPKAASSLWLHFVLRRKRTESRKKKKRLQAQKSERVRTAH